MKNYYSILGVSKTASKDEIKKSFRKLIMKYHPDKNSGSESAKKKTIELNEAYAVLSNEKLRKEYDNIQTSKSSGSTGKYPYKSAYENQRRHEQYTDNPEQFYQDYIFEDFNDFINRSFNSVFGAGLDDLFGFPSASEDLFSDLYLTPQEAYNGCRKLYTFEKPTLCPSCYGNSTFNDFIQCDTCKNMGKVLMERKLWITIPPLTPNHGRIRLQNEGTSMEGSIPGDLILTIYINRNGSAPENPEYNHHLEITIDLQKAIIGGPMTVQTPSGPIRIKLPKGIRPGKKLRIKNEGNINPQTLKRGHIYITFDVQFPADPTRTQQLHMDKLMKNKK